VDFLKTVDVFAVTRNHMKSLDIIFHSWLSSHLPGLHHNIATIVEQKNLS